MITTIYKRAFDVLLKKPFKLWGISLLASLLTIVFGVLFAVPLGLPIAISMLISTSMTIIFLNGYRGEDVKVVQLFECFKDWATIKRVLCGMSWSALWIFLWALIPFVGWIFAIIRAYEYRLVPYILVTEPEIAPTEAIKVSKERTNGYKGQMFLADFLIALIYFVVSFVIGLFSAIPYLGILFSFAGAVISICYTVLYPLFIGLVQAAFYEEIQNPTMPNIYKTGNNFCPHCGAPITEEGKFCTACGKNLAGDE